MAEEKSRIERLQEQLAKAEAEEREKYERAQARWQKKFDKAHEELSLAEKDFERAQNRMDRAESDIDKLAREGDENGYETVVPELEETAGE